MDGVSVPWQRLVAFGIAVLLLIGFWLFLKRTRLGWALRACAQDREAAALQGMSINKLALIAMGLGAGLAGAAGAMPWRPRQSGGRYRPPAGAIPWFRARHCAHRRWPGPSSGRGRPQRRQGRVATGGVSRRGGATPAR